MNIIEVEISLERGTSQAAALLCRNSLQTTIQFAAFDLNQAVLMTDCLL